jgi:hypothetical protein
VQTCRSCGEAKSHDEFPQRRTTCRECRSEQRRQQDETRKRARRAPRSLYVFATELGNFTYGSHPGARRAAIECTPRAVLVEFHLDAADALWKRPVRRAALRSTA